MKLFIADGEFEQEIKPLVRAFFQNEALETELTEFVAVKDSTPDEKVLAVSSSDKGFSLAFYKSGTEIKGCGESYTSEDEKSRRNQLCRKLYSMLSEITGRELPWGMLTGVRPVKIVYEALEQGKTQAEAGAYMQSEYLCSEEKIALSMQVAQKEKEILDRIDYKNGYSIYIGIPFCPTTCSYCSFTSFPIEKNAGYVEPYIQALKKEIAYASDCIKGKRLNTLYFGGGTPTALSAPQLYELLSCVKDTFPCEELFEFTVEAGRPDSITEDKLKVLKEMGVKRISINPQTMNDKTLEAIGRRHSAAQIVEAYELARKIDFENINMDLIIGLQGETEKEVEYTLKEIGKMQPDSLTVHTLALKRAARLNIEGMKFKDMATGNVEAMLKQTSDFAAANEYLPYYLYRQKNMSENLENVGYSKAGKEGIYNILIMEEKQTILALGAGATSKFVFHKEGESAQIERVENVKNLKDYIERTDEMIERKRSFFEKYGERC